MVIVPALLSLGIVYCVAFAERSTTMAVPIKFCKAQYTGRTKSEDIAMQSCAAYDQNMTCTAPITTWSTVARNETRVTCDFVEWR
ncbi:hypothetical protein LXA47_19940 [Massilia sp. P8910]|uniref:hypothetical protein n=1 Tax=Massilia antarctica TaxID=2765360 RepID=UPI001E52B354|nr:hypothetical protein [Massilia antarctica]MCE3605857.1 hypothetical protein [Massilia antarctica]